jgi:DNA-binding NtrC family response regulator/pSer/pThr/pTyr-binding forkhead associated (FHA) protein
MTALVLSRDGQELVSFPVDRDEISIGRDHSNEVIIPDPALPPVAAFLAVYDEQERTYVLHDVSEGELSINSKPIVDAETELTHGDVIQIGGYAIRLDTARELPLQSGLTGQVIPKHTTVHRDALLEYRGKTFVVSTEKAFTIGSADDSDLIIKSGYVSAHHCQIERKKKHWVIRDLRSRNGTFVNGGAVLQSFGLPRLAEIEVGDERLVFDALGSGQDAQHTDARWVFGMLAESDRMRRVLRNIPALLQLGPEEPILILAESGCGKDLVAHALHAQSSRADRPFVRLNCSTVSPTLAASELFGHIKGAFTGADKDRPGIFEGNAGATIFLDEIGDLPLDTQPQLLHVIENGVVRRVGAMQDTQVDVRIIAATNRNLGELVHRGAFRADLFHRFVLRLHIPPLRERREDILPLLRHFLRQHADHRRVQIRPDAEDLLLSHRWNGNIRELRNVLLLAMVEAHGSDSIGGAEIRAAIETYWSGSCGDPAERAPDVDERRRLLDALEANRWNVTKTADALEVNKDTVYRWMQRLGIETKRKRRSRIQGDESAPQCVGATRTSKT